jgi:hypoxanthine-guanine phosphoribosyltransferase
MPNQFPFETSYQNMPALAESMHFYGPLSTIIGDLATTQVTEYVSKYFWHPARLVRAAVNGGDITGEPNVELVQDATDYAASAYTGTPTVEQFSAVANRLAGHGFFTKWVEQTYDPTTLEAQRPERAAAAAERLHAHIGVRDLLVLPICHGGLLPAIEGTAYYQRMTGADAATYPIRYSRTKQLDRRPKVQPEALEHMREAAQDRTVVVYDDDTKTGRTVTRMLRYLQENGVQGNGLVGVVNYDRRSARLKNKQGSWFENT